MVADGIGGHANGTQAGSRRSGKRSHKRSDGSDHRSDHWRSGRLGTDAAALDFRG